MAIYRIKKSPFEVTSKIQYIDKIETTQSTENNLVVGTRHSIQINDGSRFLINAPQQNSIIWVYPYTTRSGQFVDDISSNNHFAFLGSTSGTSNDPVWTQRGLLFTSGSQFTLTKNTNQRLNTTSSGYSLVLGAAFASGSSATIFQDQNGNQISVAKSSTVNLEVSLNNNNVITVTDYFVSGTDTAILGVSIKDQDTVRVFKDGSLVSGVTITETIPSLASGNGLLLGASGSGLSPNTLVLHSTFWDAFLTDQEQRIAYNYIKQETKGRGIDF